MRKNAFTLIELLAVIVILAIIALIATPIVLSIINESKESAQLRSAEMYIKGLETSIATATLHNKVIKDDKYNILEDGNICLKYSKDDSSVCEEKLEIEMNGEVPSSGTVTIASGKITDIAFTYSNGKTIVKDSEGKLAFAGSETPVIEKLGGICTYENNGVAEKTAGAKYSCEVKEGTSYNFYVLKTPAEGDTTINLIMDRNIYYDATAGTGSVADATNKGLVVWQTSGSNADGPVTAMDYLYNATKDWTNIPNIEMNYTDEGSKYGTIVTIDGTTKITKKDGTAVTVLTNQKGYNNLKARLPFRSEISSYDSKTNAYLYDYLDSEEGIQTTTISGIYGYWTLSSYAVSSDFAWIVSYRGIVGGITVDYDGYYGVRAVINLKI